MASSSQFISMVKSISFTSLTSSSNENSSDGDEETISQHYEKKNAKSDKFVVIPILAEYSHSVKRRYINRDREGTNQHIWRDYFAENCTYPPDYFHRRYRMRRELSLHILKDVEVCEEYFVQKNDACGRLGCSSIQKLTAAIRTLAYGLSADYCDEYLKIGESTAIKSLKLFCKTIISLYDKQYLRSPIEQDIARLLQERAEKRFSGSHSDLNVLDHSPIFDNFIHNNMPPVCYEVNGHQHTLEYYLTDGIYPKWATLIQTIVHPTTVKEKLFALKQEAARKDVDRTFGVLQIRWDIT